VNLGPESFSPALFQKIVYAGGNAPSYGRAAVDLETLAELAVSDVEIRRFTDRVGRELQAIRDQAAEQYNKTGTVDERIPNTPQTAVIGVDGGRAQTRAEGAGRGVHEPHWREPRYACLQRFAAPATRADPHPEVPRAFLDEGHVRALVEGIKSPAHRTREKPPPPPRPDRRPRSADSPKPQALVETCVASLSRSEDFGALVAAEAARRRFPEAPRKGFLGDGQPSNWEIHAFHFPDWTPILDFIHLLSYLFTAALAARAGGKAGWTLYVHLVTAAWRGKVQHVLALFTREAERLGVPPEGAQASDPRKILLDTLRYVRNNASRMNYPEYRAHGLPVTTCAIESLIKRFNFRVKASDKFWTEPGLEAVLQVRAACLSEDDRWQRFWKTRARRLAASRRPYRARAS